MIDIIGLINEAQAYASGVQRIELLQNEQSIINETINNTENYLKELKSEKNRINKEKENEIKYIELTNIKLEGLYKQAKKELDKIENKIDKTEFLRTLNKVEDLLGYEKTNLIINEKEHDNKSEQGGRKTYNSARGHSVEK